MKKEQNILKKSSVNQDRSYQPPLSTGQADYYANKTVKAGQS